MPMFGNVGMPELILILVIALLVFGPKKLPEVGRSVGKAMREFKKATDGITGRIEKEIEVSEFKDAHRDIRAGIDSLKGSLMGILDASGARSAEKGTDGKTDVPAPAAPAEETRGEAAPAPDSSVSPYPSDDAPGGRPDIADPDIVEDPKSTEETPVPKL